MILSWLKTVRISNAGAISTHQAQRALLVGLVVLLSGCQAQQPTITVYAAASLSSVLPDTTKDFPTTVEFNFAASSILARQIENGAPADLFFSANERWVDYLADKNRIDKNYQAVPLSNQLVIIQHANAKTRCTTQTLASPEITRIAIGDWKHVPAGMYAKEALQKMQLWTVLQDKLIPALDVRAAATYVSQQAADCAIVYKTDARMTSVLVVSEVIPAIYQPTIQYTITIPKDSIREDTKKLFQYLQAKEAQKQYEEHGFIFIPQ